MTGNNNSNTTNVNVAETIVVTRHPALIDYLREIGVVTGDDVRVIESATPDDVRGRRVVGGSSAAFGGGSGGSR